MFQEEKLALLRVGGSPIEHLLFCKINDDSITIRDEFAADIDLFFSLSTIQGFVRKRFSDERF